MIVEKVQQLLLMFIFNEFILLSNCLQGLVIVVFSMWGTYFRSNYCHFTRANQGAYRCKPMTVRANMAVPFKAFQTNSAGGKAFCVQNIAFWKYRPL